jgi:hypothetical protein
MPIYRKPLYATFIMGTKKFRTGADVFPGVLVPDSTLQESTSCCIMKQSEQLPRGEADVRR